MNPRFMLCVLCVLGCGSSGATADPDGGSTADAVTTVQIPETLDPTYCSHIVDLATAGTLTGTTLQYTGSTTAAPATLVRASCQPQATHVVVMRYTVRGDNVRLRISTANAGTTAMFDTAVWAMTGCGQGAMELGCNDDDYTVDGALAGTSTLYLPAQRAGTVITLGLGGYARARRGAVGEGNFVLTVTETPSAATGGMCDPSITGGCVNGDDCATGDAMAGVCVVPSMEQEPNDDPAHANPVNVQTNVSVVAAIGRPHDVDCFGFTVTAGTDLFLDVGDGSGHCPIDLRADLYRAGQADPIDGDDDTGWDMLCPRLLPSENGGVHAMPAGDYVFCVSVAPSAGTATTPRYVVHMGPSGMSPR